MIFRIAPTTASVVRWPEIEKKLEVVNFEVLDYKLRRLPMPNDPKVKQACDEGHHLFKSKCRRRFIYLERRHDIQNLNDV